MDLISVIAMGSIVVNVGLILRNKKEHRSVNDFRMEIDKFYLNMAELGYDKDYADYILKDYTTFEDLRKVNRRMRREILKYN